jgi:hypothetical protein
MKNSTGNPNHTEADTFAVEFSDEDLEGSAGNPQSFPTFTCGMPMCGTGGSCGTFPGVGLKDSCS